MSESPRVALVISEREVDVIRAALAAMDLDYRQEIEERGDEWGEVPEHTYGLDEIGDLVTRDPIPLGGLAGVVLTFGDGCDGDTWRNVFGHCEKGYAVRISRADGGWYEGLTTHVDDGEAGWVVEVPDCEDGDEWPADERGNVRLAGVLAAEQVENIVGVHIF